MRLARGQAAEELRRKVETIVEPRRCVHLKLPSEIHAAVRIYGMKNKLSLQEILSEMCRLIADDDDYLRRRMEDLVKRKKQEKIKKITAKDTEDIYNHIATEDNFVDFNE